MHENPHQLDSPTLSP